MKNLDDTLAGIKNNTLSKEDAIDYLKFVYNEVPPCTGRTFLMFSLLNYINKKAKDI